MDSKTFNVCAPKYEIVGACPKKGVLAQCLPSTLQALSRVRLSCSFWVFGFVSPVRGSERSARRMAYTFHTRTSHIPVTFCFPLITGVRGRRSHAAVAMPRQIA